MSEYKKSVIAKILLLFSLISIIIFFGINYASTLDSFNHTDFHGLYINEIMVQNRSSYKDEDGVYEDWIELYNDNNKPISLNGLYLSDDYTNNKKWGFPDIIIQPKAYMVVFCSEKDKTYNVEGPLHTNFKLNYKDNTLTLTDKNGVIIDYTIIPDLEYNISYGRKPDGSGKFFTFDNGTPGQPNSIDELANSVNAKRLDTVKFSVAGGIYGDSMELELTSDKDTEIYYTLDGSDPTEKSILYDNKIIIGKDENTPTVIRARAIRKGYPSSEIVTNTYFVHENYKEKYKIPIVSLVTDPENLYNYETGIYVGGKIYDEWLKTNEPALGAPANYTQKGRLWERPASIEMYNCDYSHMHQDIGIRVQGAYSRANVIKSLQIIASNDYDSQHPYFSDFKFDRDDNTLYKKLVLRTSGTDYNKSFFRDSFIQGLVKELNIFDLQASKLCVLFLNGEYWGIRNIRENQDDNYISFKYNIAKEDIVILKNPTQSPGCIIDEGFIGDELHYCKLYNYIVESEKIGDIELENINQMMDMENYIEYNVLQMYICNYDWPANNVMTWRKRTEKYEPNSANGHDGRWRWMVFDLDYGFGIFRPNIYEKDMIDYATTLADNEDTKNPLWSTQMLNKLLQNESIRNMFINTFADRLNTIFSSENVMKRLSETREEYYPYVEEHIKKWDLHKSRIKKWEEQIDNMMNFAKLRPQYVRQHIINNFKLTGSSTVELSMNEGGYIKINSLSINCTDKWNGIYFNGIPITLEAIEMDGYEFYGWEGDYTSRDKSVVINPVENLSIKAVFIKKDCIKE